jgi:hypothetical protein
VVLSAVCPYLLVTCPPRKRSSIVPHSLRTFLGAWSLVRELRSGSDATNGAQRPLQQHKPPEPPRSELAYARQSAFIVLGLDCELILSHCVTWLPANQSAHKSGVARPSVARPCGDAHLPLTECPGASTMLAHRGTTHRGTDERVDATTLCHSGIVPHPSVPCRLSKLYPVLCCYYCCYYLKLLLFHRRLGRLLVPAACGRSAWRDREIWMQSEPHRPRAVLAVRPRP